MEFVFVFVFESGTTPMSDDEICKIKICNVMLDVEFWNWSWNLICWWRNGEGCWTYTLVIAIAECGEEFTVDVFLVEFIWLSEIDVEAFLEEGRIRIHGEFVVISTLRLWMCRNNTFSKCVSTILINKWFDILLLKLQWFYHILTTMAKIQFIRIIVQKNTVQIWYQPRISIVFYNIINKRFSGPVWSENFKTGTGPETVFFNKKKPDQTI